MQFFSDESGFCLKKWNARNVCIFFPIESGKERENLTRRNLKAAKVAELFVHLVCVLSYTLKGVFTQGDKNGIWKLCTSTFYMYFFARKIRPLAVCLFAAFPESANKPFPVRAGHILFWVNLDCYEQLLVSWNLLKRTREHTKVQIEMEKRTVLGSLKWLVKYKTGTREIC